MNFEQFLNHCIKHQDAISVRTNARGKWENIMLSEIPFKGAMEHIHRWHDQSGLTADNPDSTAVNPLQG
jgi:hypothetical protein